MEPTGRPLQQFNPIVVQLAVVLCHATAMALSIAILVGMNSVGLHSRGIAYLGMLSAFAPATLCGRLYQRLTQRSPSSSLSWWMALLFTLSTFGIISAATHAFGLPMPWASLDRMQSNGVIMGTGFVSLLISAILFRLGASTQKEDRDIIHRVVTRSKGKDAR